jgi:hypothetical protein
MSILSACAGKPQPHVERRFAEEPKNAPKSYAEAVEVMTVDANSLDKPTTRQELAPTVRRDLPRSHGHDHPHPRQDEPSPEAKRIAEATLILAGSAFLCTFVVVVLDGSCGIGVGFGYHYPYYY